VLIEAQMLRRPHYNYKRGRAFLLREHFVAILNRANPTAEQRATAYPCSA
jgi:hypothetical protein